MRNHSRRYRFSSLLLAALCLPLLLSACRLEVVIEGDGFLLGTTSGKLYRQGAAIDFQKAYNEVFRAVPHPGHSFGGWEGLCNTRPTECPIVVPEEVLELELDGTLQPRFMPNYSGPMRIVRSSLCSFPIPESGLYTIPVNKLDIDGLASGDAELQIYLATRDLSFWLVGEETPEGFVFDLSDRMLTYKDLVVVVSAIDANGVLASLATAY